MQLRTRSLLPLIYLATLCSVFMTGAVRAQPAGSTASAIPVNSASSAAPAAPASSSTGSASTPASASAPPMEANASSGGHAATKVHPGFYFGLAAASMWAAGSGGTWAPGADIILQGQNGHWAFGGMIRGYVSPELQAGLSSVAVNAKFFVLDANYSPYLGAGLGAYAIATRVQPDQNLTDGYGNIGFGSLFEVGFEAFRYSAVRLGVFGRVDVPFFKLEQVDLTVDSRDYVVPVSAGLYFLF